MSSKKAETTARKGYFNPDNSNNDSKRFRVLWDAFRFTFPRHAKGYEKLKMYNKLGAKLEDISMEDGRDNDETRRRLKDEPQTILLVGFEYDFLVKMVNDEETPWSHNIGDTVVDTIDWLKTWPEVQVVEKDSELREMSVKEPPKELKLPQPTPQPTKEKES